MRAQRKPTAPPPSLSPGRVSVHTAVKCGHKHSRAGGQGDGGQDGQTGKKAADLRNAPHRQVKIAVCGHQYDQVDREQAKTAHLQRTGGNMQKQGAVGLQDGALVHF